MRGTVWRELSDLILRRRWYRYGFFDGTNKRRLAARYVLGEYTRDWIPAYEKAIAEYVGTGDAVGFGAGRMALYAILEALDVGPGDEVILPAYTCVVVPNAILYRGAKPVYVDIDKDTFNIETRSIEKAVTPRTKAILAQHTFGRPCDIETILDIARRRHLVVIEDCAHAFGASLKGRRLGTFGDFAFVSTDHSKVLSTSVGGFVLCASGSDARKIRQVQDRACPLPWHCRLRLVFQYACLTFLTRPAVYWIGRVVIAILERMRVCFYFRDELNTRRPKLYPTKLSNFQAFVGWHEIQDLERNIAHRRAVAQEYHDILLGKREALTEGAYLRYSLLVDSPERCERAIGKYFTVGRWFSAVAQGRTSDWDEIGYQPGSCPVAEFVATHIINFPTHFLIDRKALERFGALVAESRRRGEVLGV